MPPKPYEWLLVLTHAAFKSDEKSFSVRIGADNADVFLGQNVTPKSEPIRTVARSNAIAWMMDVFELAGKPQRESILKGGFEHGVIKRYAIGEWSYNFGIVSQGASMPTIMTITATMTDDEVKAVQKMAAEHHYELEDVFERAFDEDIQDELNKDINSETLKDAIEKANLGTRSNPYKGS